MTKFCASRSVNNAFDPVPPVSPIPRVTESISEDVVLLQPSVNSYVTNLELSLISGQGSQLP